QRQMIKTQDAAGNALFGLREIFTAKDEPATTIFHLNRLQVNVLLFVLVLLDIALSTTAIVYPAAWTAWFHALPYRDPYRLLPRTGAIWWAFVLLQSIALF